MLKLQRNYRAEISIGTWDAQTGERVTTEELAISYPITCQLLTDVGSYTTSNTGVFQFINLAERTRSKLWLDVYERGKKWIHIKMYAGYNQTMPLIYEGEVTFCLSSRPGGSTEWITEMQTINNGDFFKYGYLNATFTKETTIQDILDLALEKYPNLKPGYITPDIQPLPRNKTFIGQTWDILGRDYGGYDVFIDQYGNFNILGDNDVVPGEIQVISDSTGLLGTPRRANVFVEIDSLFEPQLRTGQAISLISKMMPQFNQAYKIINVKHQGIISPVQSGKLITSVTLSTCSETPRILEKSTATTYTGNTTTGIWQKPVTNGRISSTFHEQRTTHKHAGIDIAADPNTPVYAPANGRIITAGWAGDYGKCIYMSNGNINGKPITSRYAHLNSFTVTAQQNVYQGQVIGYVGSTGRSTGPHLHFEIRENGVEVNPINYIGSY